MKTALLCLFILFECCIASAQSASMQWEKAYGSTGNDKFHGIVETQDHNYVVMGIADSINGDVGCNIKGLHDEWVIKMDPSGNILWQKCLGGTKEEEQPHNRLIATSDGGFLTAGETWSFDGNSSGNHGECDILLVKLTADGKVEWTRVLGGSDRDTPRYLYELPGKKYLVVARTTSNNGDIPSNVPGSYNAVVFKINNEGKTISTNVYGGSGKDELWAVTYTMNKYVYTGFTGSPELNAVDTDGWVLITDTNGIQITSKVYGGVGTQKFLDLATVDENEFIACGESGSPVDFYTMRFNIQGASQWEKTYGGDKLETFKSATRAKDGVYLVGGTASYGNGKKDCWLVKINFSGVKQWDMTWGGSKADWANSMTPDGYLCGYTASDDGDVTGYHGGASDGWIIKVNFPSGFEESALNQSIPEMRNAYNDVSNNLSFSIYPNPATQLVNISCNATSPVVVDILNIMGEKMMEQEASSPDVTIDISSLSPGTYFISLKSNDGFHLKPFSKQ